MTDLQRTRAAPAEPSDLLARVGSRVRHLRKQQSVSRRELSERSGVSPRYLAQLESGEGNISIGLLAKVAAALQCAPTVLLDDQATDGTAELAQGGTLARLMHEAMTGNEQLQQVVHLLCRADVATLTQVQNILRNSDGNRQRRICLIGLRGAGKSTLGRHAGGKLGIPFIELNEQIAQLAGMPVDEIIALYGPEGYRELESRALAEAVSSHSRVILAAAGGVVSNKDTYRQLLNDFHTVWLRASPAEHMQRVLAQGDTRPMAGNPAAMEQLKTLLSEREVSYAKAEHCLDTEGQALTDSLNELLAIIEPLVKDTS